MKKNFKDEIREKMHDQQISVTSLEKEANLKKSAVSNILNNRSKKPNYKTIEAIATALGCTAFDLIGVDEEKYNDLLMRTPKKPSDKQISWDPELFNKTTIAFNDSCKRNDRKPRSLSIAMALINEIYSFAIHKKLSEPDQEFVDWVVVRSL